MPTVKQLIDHLTNDFKPDDVIAYDIWQVGDVKNMVPDIDDPEYVLEQMHQEKDANVGLNWGILEFWCEN